MKLRKENTELQEDLKKADNIQKYVKEISELKKKLESSETKFRVKEKEHNTIVTEKNRRNNEFK